jgi:hypothetical protein
LNDSRLFKVEFAFDTAFRFVAKRAVPAQIVDPLALRLNQLALYLASITHAVISTDALLMPFETSRTVLITRPQRLRQISGKRLSPYQLIKTRQGGLYRVYSRPELASLLELPLAAPSFDQPKSPENERQQRALAEQSREDHAEGEEQDCVAVREWLPAG